MIGVARENAEAYGLEDRWDIIEGSGEKIPLGAEGVDAVFSSGSLHEWSEPVKTFNEIMRVLKPGGKFFIGDLRRDILSPVKWFMRMLCKPKEIRPGLGTSIRAAYTPREISGLLADTAVSDYTVNSDLFGISITGLKK
jgi:ubiquinone/menaquinone biosynthesis C-methylase UbiE